MGWKSIGVVALGLALAGCPEPETEYRLTGANYSFNITGCLGLPEDAGPSSCVRGMRRVADDIRGCVVLESGNGERDAAEIVFEANGQISGGGALQVTLDSTLEAGLFVFDVAGGDALGRCLGGGFGPADGCTPEDGCVLKLYQTPVPGPEAGGGPDGGFSEIDFRAPDGLCDVRWAGAAPTDLCSAGDDDCDGDADEALDGDGNRVAVGAACGDGGGGDACQVVWTCGDDGRAYCPEAGAGGIEACDGVDNDCDGQTDEGLVDCCPDPGTTRPCNTESDCPDGQQTCGMDRRWGPCLDPMTMMPIGGEEPEICNGEDDDCDGFSDEDFALGGPGGPTTGAACDVPNPPDACQSRGRVVCVDAMTAMCEPDAVQPQPEVCDGADNDCDGDVDEDVPPRECWGDVPEVNRGVGICVPGSQRCVEGGAGDFGPCSGAVSPGGEVCQLGDADQVDDDCDGDVDEGGFEPSCGLCPAEIVPEVCGNDVDEDCDGRTDEAEPLDDPANCGACGNDCNVQDGVVYNAEFVCMAGQCDAVGCLQGYFDLEPEAPDGICECQADDERIGFADLDCDGVEGATRNNSYLFVSPSHGEERGTGAAHIGHNRQNQSVAPYRSLQQALDEVAAIRDGIEGVPPAITIVLEVGTYEMPGGLDIPEGVSILGGYTYEPGDDVDLGGLPIDQENALLAREHAWRRTPVAEAGDNDKTIITGHHALVRYGDLRVRTVLDNVELRASDAIDDATRSSAVVIAEDVGEHLVISNSVLIAGAGFDGAQGPEDDADAPEAGADGAAGTDTDEDGLGGAGAPARACAAGLPVVDADIPVASGGRGGNSAQAGLAGGRSDANQVRSRGGDPGQNSPGEPGRPGDRGANGANSAPGPADGRAFAARIPWAPRGSAAGRSGLPGAGGGGGGGGDPRESGGDAGGGGGGGSGGCPGRGAAGASGGGGSFGLIVRGGSVALHETEIRTAVGGIGGDGRRGGIGARGGFGGLGARGECAGCTDGGNGGNGGEGGCGGNSAGAAGGPSVAILLFGDAEVDFVRAVDSRQIVADVPGTLDRLLTPGDGGDGGRGGDVGGDCGPAAGAGPVGAVHPIGCCADAATCTPGAGPALACPN